MARPATALLAVLTLACGGGDESPRNVLLVSLDTVRADHIGCYGREDAGTPTLDALAGRGTRFADATAPNPTTLPSHATLLTGYDVLRHGVRNNGMFSLSPSVETLAEGLADAGIRTGAFVASRVLGARYGIAQGFEEYTEPPHEKAQGSLYIIERSAALVNRDALAWLDGIDDQPFFLFVHYMEAHVPYEPPEPERTSYARDPYQGEIAAADRALGDLLAALEERGRLSDTLVLVVADHGEALGDHGEPNHGIFLYQATLRVPMIAAGPGVRPGRTVAEPVGLVDVTPTILDALGLEAAEPSDGTSLWPTLRGADSDPDRRIYSETFLPRYDYGWSELRALRQGPFKYVAAPRPELYRVDLDPSEARNLMASEPETAARLAADLDALVGRVEAEGRTAQRVQLEAGELEALAALGYLAGAAEPGEGTDLDDPKEHIGKISVLGGAESFIHRGQYELAERSLRELVAERPSFLNARTRLILVLVLQGKTAEAIAAGRALDEAAARGPDGARFTAPAHVVLAQMYLDEERLEEAVRELETAMIVPQSPEIHDLLAALYHDLGRREEAIRLLRGLVDRGDAGPRSIGMLRALEAERD